MNRELKKLLSAKKQYKRYVALLLCLSLMVGLATFSALTRKGEALTHQKRVLECAWKPTEGEAYADYCAHTHNDDCYNEQGILVCPLPEIPAHYHTDACWETVKELVCDREESCGHVHTDACYARAAEPACGLEESEGHHHGDACYARATELACGLVESDGHHHSDACYEWTRELACGQEEGEEHTHDESCYKRVRGELICGQEESEVHHHTEACYPLTDELICGQEESGGHHHTEACYPLTNELICGKEEGEGAHTHDESCYRTSRKLICGQQGIHIHNSDCYDEEGNLVCGQKQLKVHVHNDSCFKTVEMTPEEIAALEENSYDVDDVNELWFPAGDPSADVESEAYWNSMFAGTQFTGNWAEDLLTVARSQIGYAESTANYATNERGAVKGYTRYGAWYGIPYGDWCAMFVSFCIRYAGIPAEAMPVDCGCIPWVNRLSAAGMFGRADDYTPKAGDIVFFDFEKDGLADHVGIVAAVDGAAGSITTIEGNRTDWVDRFTLRLGDGSIMGYGILPENPEAALPNLEEADSAYPARHFEGSTDEVNVVVEAPEGAFPKGTTMEVTMVDAETVMDSVSEAVKGEIVAVKAVDITFRDADRAVIEPLRPVSVVMTPVIIETQETLPEQSAAAQAVVHVPDSGEAAVMAQGENKPDTELSFESDAFSTYVLVYTAQIQQDVITTSGETYRITVTYGSEAGIPENALIEAYEIPADSEEYSFSAQRAAEMVNSDLTQLSYMKLLDISILNGDGKKVTLNAPVEVQIELLDRTDKLSAENENTTVVHFGEQAEILESTANGGVVTFKTEGFSVYAVVGITIEKNVLASDGKNYKVTVTYGPETGIPQDADLAVKEILDESAEYAEYVSKTENTLGMEEGSAGYIRLFDISIVDKNDPEIKYQPKEGTTVEVHIELADAENGKSFSVVHFAEDESTDNARPEVLASITAGAAVSFQTNGFSVYAVATTVDISNLDEKTYGLINTKDGAKPSGIAMMSTAQNNGTKLQGKSTTVRVNTVNRTDYVYVANNSNITMWTFHETGDDKYYITTQVNGITKYLNVSTNGVSLVDTPNEDCSFTVTPGAGTYAGKYKFSTDNGVLRLNGGNFERAATNNSADAWMNFADLSELNEDDFVTYTAQKASISEAAGEVSNGEMVILYTRIWNKADNRYDYYVVDYDGKLVKAYESGDTISWVGSQINTMLWDFTEYYYEGSSTPNGYYELQNNYSGKYIAPKTSNGSETFLSDSTIGINLNGRGSGDYYTTILAWDDYYYASLKVDEENVRLLSSTLAQASDFYFAKISTNNTATMEVTTVSTVDHTQYGITLKMQDFGGNDVLTDGRSEEMDNILGATAYEQWTGTKDLLQNYIAEGSDYPVATYSNQTLGSLFSQPITVNNQFLTRTYYETGYFEYDSTRNYAHLITSESDPWFGLTAPNGSTYKVGDFVVYGQLGTSSEGNKDTLRHGQFFPYNDIISGFKTDDDGNLILDEDGNPIPIAISISTKYSNTMDIHADPLSSLDPAYGEALYEITYNKNHSLPNVDHFFGMEMSASFMQSADGLDAWGHDLIFEFSGDDDFWLYVDDVLVLDLGGIHSALDGSVNFRTGRIVENGTEYWLKDRFEAAYRAQHTGEADLETNLQDWLKGIFKVETVVVDGVEQEIITNVFKDYSSHTMRMFYLERGAGASNIHMRFNISEYKEGGIQLQKKVSGTENSDELFPFQIWYEEPVNHVMVSADGSIAVTDSQSEEQVPYQSEYSVQVGENTLVYEDVFFLKAGQTVNIQLPSEDTPYYIRECALDSPATCEWVKINDVLTEGSDVAPQRYNGNPVIADTTIQADGRLDFNAAEALVSERKKVIYENHVNETAMKNLTITKRLWRDEGMTSEIFSGSGEGADNTEFSFRVYIGMEDGTYTLYKNGPYRVKDPAGEYCYFHNGGFVSTGKTVFNEITDDIVGNDPEILLGDTLQQRCTFHTGRGSVSKIKAGYTVEIPGLMNGTPFIVLERDNEIPSGYNRLGYGVNSTDNVVPGEILTATTEGGETSLLMAGEINSDKAVTVHNQHGYTLIAKKVWSDAAFMEDHDEIYFAVYLKENDNSLSLIENSVRQLGRTDTTLNWFFPKLEEGKNLNDYVVYEVRLNVPEGSTLGTVTVDALGKVTGYTTVAGETSSDQPITEENIIRIEEGGILTAGGNSNEHGYSASMEYVAGYSREVLTLGENGKYPNIRTDTVSNSRPGIKIIKKDMNAGLLEGAVFTFSNRNNLTKTFRSDENGLVVVAYLLPGTEYTLNENTAPYGYQVLIDSVTIKVGDDGTVYVNGSADDHADGYYTVTQVSNPSATNMPTITIRNREVMLKAVKTDSSSSRPMPGVKFALYKEVYASTGGLPDPSRPMPDYTPMDGYEDLITDTDGVIPKIVLKNADNPDGLPAGHYYLREVETPAGYLSLGFDIRINLSSTGQVTIQRATRPTQAGQDWVIDSVPSDVAEVEQISDSLLQITVRNTPKDPIRIRKVEMGTDKTLAGVKFELYRSNQIENGLPKQGETPVISDTTDENGILSLGGLEGLYFLFETETLPGYNLLSGAIQITASAESNTVTAFLSGYGKLTSQKVKDADGKDIWEITIENSTGYELPETGGAGTERFTAAGAAMITCAGMGLLISMKSCRRRKN